MEASPHHSGVFFWGGAGYTSEEVSFRWYKLEVFCDLDIACGIWCILLSIVTLTDYCLIIFSPKLGAVSNFNVRIQKGDEMLF